jgi:hypothetical protein
MKALGLAIIAFVALQIYLGKSAEFPPSSSQSFVPAEQVSAPAPVVQSIAPIIEQPAAAIRSAELFSCDGRETCGQMTSKDEAQFFVRSCPNTRMDGDGDGDACENDTRF